MILLEWRLLFDAACHILTDHIFVHSGVGLGGFCNLHGPFSTELILRENVLAISIGQSNTDTHFNINIHEMEAINHALRGLGSWSLCGKLFC
jgi:hypothetical protein